MLRMHLFASILAPLLALLMWALAGAVQAQASGTVVSVIGSVRIIPRQGHERAAIKGDHLREGDTVTTGANANAQIRMSDDAVIWLKPQSKLQLDQYPAYKASEKQAVAMNLVEGGLRTVTGSFGKDKPENYKVATPNATIGVRGTEYEALYAGPRVAEALGAQPGTYSRVYEGVTSLKGPAGEVEVAKDQAAFMGLKPEDPPVVLQQIPAFLNPVAVPVPRDDLPTAVQRTLTVTVAYGGPMPGGAVARPAGSDFPVQAREGDRASLPPRGGAAAAGGNASGAAGATDFIVKLDGNQAQIRFYPPAGRAGPSTALTLAVGVWSDVSSRGPWANTGNVISTADLRGDANKVYLKVEEAGR